MRMKAWPLILVTALVVAAPAHAFRCGNKLIREGDTRSEVLAKCGDPVEVERRTALREPIYWVNGRPFRVGGGYIEIPLETWIYNLGPSKLMRRLHFENGVLVEIETLKYGYLENR